MRMTPGCHPAAGQIARLRVRKSLTQRPLRRMHGTQMINVTRLHAEAEAANPVQSNL